MKMLNANTTLAEIVVSHPAASRVFQRYGLDFCCHGQRRVEEACAERGLLAPAVLAEVESEEQVRNVSERWDTRPLRELISHIVDCYHRRLREELPLLVAMAERVEKVHVQKPSCPGGLA